MERNINDGILSKNNPLTASKSKAPAQRPEKNILQIKQVIGDDIGANDNKDYYLGTIVLRNFSLMLL